jgi:hypothetical protein
VSGDEEDAKAAAMAWMRKHQATAARAEPVQLDVMESAYVPAGRAIEAAAHDDNQITWHPAARRPPASGSPTRSPPLIRAGIADGSLRAGMHAPSGAELAKETGFAIVTCRRGLERLFREGVLMQMARSTRYRVAGAPPAKASSSRTRWRSGGARPASHRRSSPARLACPSRRSATPSRAGCGSPAGSGSVDLALKAGGAPARLVRRVAGGLAARHDGGRARHDDHASPVRRGQGRHHPCLRPGTCQSQVGDGSVTTVQPGSD